MGDQAVLLVEGKDDRYVVEHLCKARGIPLTSFVIHHPQGAAQYSDAGIDPLLEQVPLRLQAGVDRLAVIVDADENAASRWAQLRDRLRRADLGPVPEVLQTDGTVMEFDLETRAVRLGVWIMPNNSLPGMIEDFLAWLVPRDDKMLPHVDRFLERIPASERLFTNRHLPKVRIHSYLAVQKEPGKPLGLAISFRYLDPDREEVVGPFLRWLQSVLID